MPTFADADPPADWPDGPQPARERRDWSDPQWRPEREYQGEREFFSDNAAATLTMLEEGALRGLASLAPEGLIVSVGDLSEFCAGFCRSQFTTRDMRHALMALDALGWVRAANDLPLTADYWSITEQGRIALEGRTP